MLEYQVQTAEISGWWNTPRSNVVRLVAVGAADSNVALHGKHLQACRPGNWLLDEVRAATSVAPPPPSLPSPHLDRHRCDRGLPLPRAVRPTTSSLPSTLPSQNLNLYGTLLQGLDLSQCRQDSQRKPSFFYNTYFMEKLLEPEGRDSYDYTQVKGWYKMVRQVVKGGDIFGLRMLFVFVNVGALHWTLIVAFVEEKRFEYYDSMGGQGVHYLRAFRQYLVDEHRRQVAKGTRAADDEFGSVNEWPCEEGSFDTPQQMNGERKYW